MRRIIVDYGQSVRARLLMLANQRGVQLEYVLLRYALERFLYRLGISAQSNRFVLKGASAFAVWMGPFCRVTRDADLEAFGDASPESLCVAFREICDVSCSEDGVTFDLSSITANEIKKGDLYPGVRIVFRAVIGGASVPMQFDIGFGDSIFPQSEIMDYPVLLDGMPPQIRIYPRYTIIAEKFQVMVHRGLLNSRLKDYYDIWMLTEHFDFDLQILQSAIERTFKRRGTSIPFDLPEALSDGFAENNNRQIQWRGFLKRSGVAEIDLVSVVKRLANFFAPVFNEMRETKTWCHENRAWTNAISGKANVPDT